MPWEALGAPPPGGRPHGNRGRGPAVVAGSRLVRGELTEEPDLPPTPDPSLPAVATVVSDLGTIGWVNNNLEAEEEIGRTEWESLGGTQRVPNLSLYASPTLPFLPLFIPTTRPLSPSLYSISLSLSLPP